MTSPLPSFTWADGRAMWEVMLEKDRSYCRRRNPRMLDAHPSLVPEFRTILLDWLSEVSKACKFHRETYHLSIDFIDRYLSVQKDIPKLQLQLIGTTCLFIAAKFEEIRPPTVFEFAELTDGAYTANEIIAKEIVILGAIRWNITPLTANSWLNTYLQLLASQKTNQATIADNRNNHHHHHHHKLSPSSSSPHRYGSSSPEKSSTNDINATVTPPAHRSVENNFKNGPCDSFIIPKAELLLPDHKRIECLVDLALLDIESVQFAYSVLAASALYFFTDMATVQLCTGFTFNDIRDCVIWMKPFAEMARLVRVPVTIVPSGPNESSISLSSGTRDVSRESCGSGQNGTPITHQLHHHLATKALLDRVHERQATRALKNSTSTVTNINVVPAMASPEKPSTLMTPPRSTKKRRITAASVDQKS